MKAIPQYTSLDAFLYLTPKHLCHAQKAVFDVISRLGEATDKEIAGDGRLPNSNCMTRRNTRMFGFRSVNDAR